MKYPAVADEFDTLRLVIEGKSIARYGDGEFKLVRGGNCISQRMAPGLQRELQAILRIDDPRLLVAIPRLDPRNPKNDNWASHCGAYCKFLSPDMRYYSAFITRPDNAPWIATDEYFDAIEGLWRGQDVIMVYGSDRSLSETFPPMASAKSIAVVKCDYAHTYHRVAELTQRIVELPQKRVLLMCGPTATCLASRLVMYGKHAIDLGHIGMFWRIHRSSKWKHEEK